MAMAGLMGLQRSAQTFRRSGSSGLVWDERFLTECSAAGAAAEQPELRHSRSVGSVAAMLRRGGGEAEHDEKKRKLVLMIRPKQKEHRKKQEEELVVVTAGTGRKAFRTRDVAPAAEPPSPRVPAGCCAPCAIFRDARDGARGSSSLPLRRACKKR